MSLIFRTLEQSALPNLAHIEHPCDRYPISRKSLFEKLRRLEDIFLCQHPGSPLVRLESAFLYVDRDLTWKTCLGSIKCGKVSLLLHQVLRLEGLPRIRENSKKKSLTCIPIARLHFVSLKILTLSKGFACMGDMIQRGS